MKRCFRKTAAPRLLLAAALGFVLTTGISAQSSRSGKEAKADESPAANASEATRGKGAYTQRCAICHYPDSAAQKIGPGLKDLYKRGKFANGRKVDDAGVKRWIELGGRNMPGFKKTLKPDEIRDLIAYIKTL